MMSSLMSTLFQANVVQKNQKDERNSIATMFCGARKTGKFQFPLNILSEIIYRHICMTVYICLCVYTYIYTYMHDAQT